METPKHDEHSHGADSMRTLAMAEKSSLVYDPSSLAMLNNSLDYARKHSSEYAGL